MAREHENRDFEGGRGREDWRERSDREGRESRSGQGNYDRDDRSGPDYRGEDYRSYGYGGQRYDSRERGSQAGGYGGRYFGSDYGGQGYGSQGHGGVGQDYGGGRGAGGSREFDRPGWGSIEGMAQSQDWGRFGQRRGGEYSNIFDDERQQGSQQRGGFRGRGPKGYARSDERIREDVSQRLEDAEDVDPSEVTVEVDDGRVRLTGNIDSRWAKRYCEDVAYQVRGVKDVQNHLDVEQEGARRGREQERRGEGQEAGGQQRAGTSTATSTSESMQRQANP